MLTKDQIRDIFLSNGFTIKEGQTDLKDYVYDAAADLINTLLRGDIDKYRYGAYTKPGERYPRQCEILSEDDHTFTIKYTWYDGNGRFKDFVEQVDRSDVEVFEPARTEFFVIRHKDGRYRKPNNGSSTPALYQSIGKAKAKAASESRICRWTIIETEVE